MTNNPIVHWEILGPDGEAQRSFYSTIFDWNLAAVDGFPSYFTAEDDGIGVGGAVGRGMDEMPSYTCIYVQVEDIDQTLAAVNDGGGTTVVPRTVIPDVVTFALFTDPAGNLVGLTEPDG